MPGRSIVRTLRPLVLALGLLAPQLHAEDPRVGFVKPRVRSTVIGSSVIELRVMLPESAQLERLEILIDGVTLARLSEPPWSVPWDAGDGSSGHRLEAVLVTTDGRETRAVIQTRALSIDLVEKVDLVNLYLIVRDPAGAYVRDLGQDDFRILENGDVQSIERFSTTHKPLRIGIVLDTSLTMSREQKLVKAKSAALQFLDVLQPGDEAMVVTFSDSVKIPREFTSERAKLATPIRNAEAEGGTALYDAIWRTSRKLAGFDGRRVLVLLSDGRDEASNGLEPGSLHTLEEAVDQALRNEVMVFTLGLGHNLDREYAMRWGNLGGRTNVDTNQSLEAILRRLAEETGGRALIASSASKLRKAFDEFATDLRHQYSLAYSPTDERHDGRWRKIRVRIPGREDLEVVTRKGYYAPED